MADLSISDHLRERARNPGHEEELVRAVYAELRRMAHHYLGGEDQQRTLQTTALVHEAYLRLVGNESVVERGRSYFFAAAARAMRQVLVDAARKRVRTKRGGQRPLELDGFHEGFEVEDTKGLETVLFVHDSLDQLAREHPRAAQVVECRFFGGLSLEETTQVLETSKSSVKRDWSLAKAWLYRSWSD